MSKFYSEMPKDFKEALEVIKEYCQFEDCQESNCDNCRQSLLTIRCSDLEVE